jgi:ribonuclease-3 family protein
VGDPRARSIRTLAWLGDARFELETRARLSARGDYSTDRLDAMKAAIVRAEAQAALLADVQAQLSEQERDVVGRGRNAAVSGGRGGRDTRAYRAATGLEALVGWWHVAGDDTRIAEVLVPRIEAAIDAALERDARRPRRG